MISQCQFQWLDHRIPKIPFRRPVQATHPWTDTTITPEAIHQMQAESFLLRWHDHRRRVTPRIHIQVRICLCFVLLVDNIYSNNKWLSARAANSQSCLAHCLEWASPLIPYFDYLLLTSEERYHHCVIIITPLPKSHLSESRASFSMHTSSVIPSVGPVKGWTQTYFCSALLFINYLRLVFTMPLIG